MLASRAYASLLLIISAISSAACASVGEPARVDRSSTDVEVVNIAYSPATIRIKPGTEVTWVNEDDSVHHTVTSGAPAEDSVPGVSKGKPARPDGEFDGDLPDASSEFRFTFDSAGTYAYFCNIHPSMMGEVVVE